MPIERAIAYIDGFNLHHAIDTLSRPYLKWVNPWDLVESFLREGQTLTAVNYYSAYPTWLPPEFARHRQYVRAIAATGVTAHMSQFATRQRRCFTCGASWESHEEKQTDVRMAVDLVSDALEDKFDMAVVITADSDLRPAVAKVRATLGKRLLMIAPPGRFSRARDLQHNIAITPGRIVRHLFPQQIIQDGQIVATRPPEYDPPQ
jgi:uncharacterized LabA/DUF88 family protein